MTVTLTTTRLESAAGLFRALWAVAWAAFAGTLPRDAAWLLKAAATAIWNNDPMAPQDYVDQINQLLSEAGRVDRVHLNGDYIEWRAGCPRPGWVKVNTARGTMEAYGDWRPEIKNRRQRLVAA